MGKSSDRLSLPQQLPYSSAVFKLKAASVQMDLIASSVVQSGRGPTEQVSLVTVPPVCQQAIQEREAQALAHALEYDKRKSL